MRKKLYPLLVQYGASRRLLNTLWKFEQTFTVGQDITLGQFIRDWPLKRLRKELFGFGKTAQEELRELLAKIALDGHPKYQGLYAYSCSLTENQALGPVATAKRIVAAIEELRSPAGSGNSVDILCVNDDPPPTEAIICCGDWTGYAEHRFEGDTLLDCLTKAVTAQRQSNSHLK